FRPFDTYMAPYVPKDQLDYPHARHHIQDLIHNLNLPSRGGPQTPFTHLTVDWVCPQPPREHVPLIGGQDMCYCYGELPPVVDLINRACSEVMSQGEARGLVFTLPIPTYNITHDFPWHSDNAERLFAMTAKYGLPYCQNFLNSE